VSRLLLIAATQLTACSLAFGWSDLENHHGNRGSEADASADTKTDRANVPEALPDPKFCAKENPAKHVFCSDFESGSITDGAWQAVMTAAGAALRVEAAPAGGKMLVSTTPAAKPGQDANAIVIASFPSEATEVKLTWKMDVSSCSFPTAGGNAKIAVIGRGASNRGDTETWGVSLNLSADGFRLRAGPCKTGNVCDQPFKKVPAPPTVGRWSRFVMTVDIARETVSLTIDDEPSFRDEPIELNPLATGATLVNLGHVNQGAGECRVEYDDVTLDAL
jgi:hypothetical protein